MATTFNAITAWAISRSLIAENEKLTGIASEAIDEVTVLNARVDEIADGVFVALVTHGMQGSDANQTQVMTTNLGEVREFKSAGAALEAIKLLTFAGVELTVIKLAHDQTPTTSKSRVARYKKKRSEHIIALGNLAYIDARATATPAGPLLVELLERKDAITAWVEKIVASVDDLAVSITADGIDPATLVI